MDIKFGSLDSTKTTELPPGSIAWFFSYIYLSPNNSGFSYGDNIVYSVKVMTPAIIDEIRSALIQRHGASAMVFQYFCPLDEPQLSGSAEASQLRADLDEALDYVYDEMSQGCQVDAPDNPDAYVYDPGGVNEKRFVYNSMALSAYAGAIRLLSRHGRLRILDDDGGRCVVAVPCDAGDK